MDKMKFPINQVICGDALKILQTFPSNCVHLAITSPPYNVGIRYPNHDDNMNYADYISWLGTIWSETKRVLVKGGRLCINIGENRKGKIKHPTFSDLIRQITKIGLLYRGIIVWDKATTVNRCAWGSWKSPQNPHIVPSHEYIVIFSKDDFSLGGDSQKIDITKEEFVSCSSGIWGITPATKNGVHPASFPEEIPKRLIKFYSYAGNTVLDMFAGTGTVGIAAKKLGRDYILIDNAREYCDLAIENLNRLDLSENQNPV